MLHVFTVRFLESFESSLLLLVVLPSLIETLAQLLAWRHLLWLFMTLQWRYLTQSNFLSITWLAWSLALNLLFLNQENPLWWKEIHTHTHTHTHTHPHTHTHTWQSFENSKLSLHQKSCNFVKENVQSCQDMTFGLWFYLFSEIMKK